MSDFWKFAASCPDAIADAPRNDEARKRFEEYLRYGLRESASCKGVVIGNEIEVHYEPRVGCFTPFGGFEAYEERRKQKIRYVEAFALVLANVGTQVQVVIGRCPECDKRIESADDDGLVSRRCGCTEPSQHFIAVDAYYMDGEESWKD